MIVGGSRRVGTGSWARRRPGGLKSRQDASAPRRAGSPIGLRNIGHWESLAYPAAACANASAISSRNACGASTTTFGPMASNHQRSC